MKLYKNLLGRNVASVTLATSLLFQSPAFGLPLVSGVSEQPIPTQSQSERQAQVRIMINVPAFRLSVIEDGKTVAVYKIAIGMPKHRTPIKHNGKITEIQYQPTWYPPPSEWAKNDRITPYGPKSPLGEAKMGILPMIFVHGTNNDGSIGKAATHGCIRMWNRDVLSLADFLEKTVGGSRRGKIFTFGREIPVDVEYETIDAKRSEDGKSIDIKFYRDIYWRNTNNLKKLEAALSAAGIDSAKLDNMGLELVLKKAKDQLKKEREVVVKLDLESLKISE